MATDPKIMQPAVEIVDISDPAMVNPGIELMVQDVVQLQSSPFRAKQVIVRLGGAIVVYYSTNLRLRTRPKLHNQLLGYVTFGPNSTGLVNGRKIRHDTMIMVAPGERVGFVADEGYESITFLLGVEDIRNHLDVRGRNDDLHLSKGVDVLSVGDDQAGALFAWGQRLIDMAMWHPEFFNDHREHRIAAEVDLIEVLLSTLSGANKLEMERQEKTRQGQSAIVYKAEQYALAHIADNLYVTDLCREVGVSERTLVYAFRAVMNLSPVAYLARLRLHRVHENLLSATPDKTNVTTVALNWGFWHFGEFSRAYKECFGELPSETLRGSQVERDTD